MTHKKAQAAESETLQHMNEHRQGHSEAEKPANKFLGIRWRKKHKVLGLAIPILAIVVLSSSATATYLRLAANKPENKVATGLFNLTNQWQYSSTGNLTVSQPVDSGFSLDYHLDVNKSDAQLSSNLNYRGTSTPIDIKVINNNLYFKVNISSLRSINNPSIPYELRQTLWGLRKVRNDQWYVLNTRLWELGGGRLSACRNALSLRPDATDRKAYREAYKSNDLFKVNTVTPTTINGIQVTKYDVGITNADNMQQFGRNLAALGAFNNISYCISGTSGNDSPFPYEVSNYSNAKLTVFLDQDNEIRKLTLDDQQIRQKTNFNMDITPAVINIVEPANARSALSLFL